MPDVFRLSKSGRNDLDYFKSHYLLILKDKASGSDFLLNLYNEKLEWSDSDWIEFAIRLACNHCDAEDFIMTQKIDFPFTNGSL